MKNSYLNPELKSRFFFFFLKISNKYFISDVTHILSIILYVFPTSELFTLINRFIECLYITVLNVLKAYSSYDCLTNKKIIYLYLFFALEYTEKNKKSYSRNQNQSLDVRDQLGQFLP